MIKDITIRRITCDRCNSSFEYESKDEQKLTMSNKFIVLYSADLKRISHSWHLCNTCYKSFINWLAFGDDTKTRPEKLRGSDNG